ncbi:heavy metal sensor histidine kinase [Rhodanobacter aciditrophus]|uniref:heavy metal sensor histidine kinase n=1 Tax=Rhodanobacter aciditrophus TaxID=1623218 RepID=UPI003CFBAB3E
MTTERPRRTSSIGGRLTLLYTLVVLAAMALLATMVMWQLSAAFNAEHQRFLRAKTAEMQTDLDDGHGQPGSLLREIAKETDESAVRQYQARVLSGAGRILGETPGMQEALPPGAFAESPSAPDAIRMLKVGARAYALATTTLRASRLTAPLHVQIAMDVTRDAALLAELRRAIWLAFALLTPALVVAGYFVAEHALAPLKRIANAAREVTPKHLSARIPTDPPWPRELDELVAVFNSMLGRLEEAFGRLSRFSSDLAHELRTPLSNMRSSLDVCLLRERSGGEYREALESNLEECRRLHALVDNLLFMARAERTDAALHVEAFDGAEACRWVIAQQLPGASSRGLGIQLQGNARVHADPLLFRHALTNLLANAIQHSKAREDIRVELRAQADGGTEVQVTDRGIGIAADHQPHVFDRFYQASPSRRHADGEGTGLGLAIVKSIVEAHGGAVALDSQPGLGTTVSLRFPPSPPAQQRA